MASGDEETGFGRLLLFRREAGYCEGMGNPRELSLPDELETDVYRDTGAFHRGEVHQEGL